MEIYAVVFGNYFPREIDSLWIHEDDAKARARILGGMWEVEIMKVHDAPPTEAKE